MKENVVTVKSGKIVKNLLEEVGRAPNTTSTALVSPHQGPWLRGLPGALSSCALISSPRESRNVTSRASIKENSIYIYIYNTCIYIFFSKCVRTCLASQGSERHTAFLWLGQQTPFCHLCSTMPLLLASALCMVCALGAVVVSGVSACFSEILKH